MVAALIAAFVVVPMTQARAAPVESYGRLPDLEDVGISPDGAKLAFVGSVGEDRVVSVVSIATKKPIAVLKVGNAKLRSLSWIDDNDLLLVHSVTSGLPRGLVGAKQEFRQQMLTAMVKFIETNNPPGAPAPAAAKR
jgi:hypothetical protein